MAGFIAKQPNGMYCRYSSIVDNITHYNMTEDDYIELVVSRAKEEAREILEHARPFDMVVSSLYPDTQRDLRKMNEILKECGSEVFLKEEDFDFKR